MCSLARAKEKYLIVRRIHSPGDELMKSGICRNLIDAMRRLAINSVQQVSVSLSLGEECNVMK
jgi:hypothetical protein